MPFTVGSVRSGPPMIGAGVFAAWSPAADAAGTGLLVGLAIAAVVAQGAVDAVAAVAGFQHHQLESCGHVLDLCLKCSVRPIEREQALVVEWT